MTAAMLCFFMVDLPAGRDVGRAATDCRLGRRRVSSVQSEDVLAARRGHLLGAAGGRRGAGDARERGEGDDEDDAELLHEGDLSEGVPDSPVHLEWSLARV